jgi:hypothetical protein
MRVIEKNMLNAITNVKPFKYGNTEVIVHVSYPASCTTIEVLLHGNSIALLSGSDKFLTVNKETLFCFPTVTTKSRLRALGANVTTKNHVTYLDGVAIN